MNLYYKTLYLSIIKTDFYILFSTHEDEIELGKCKISL